MECGEKCDTYSRVTGYYRPVGNWNKGKQEEFKDRKVYNVNTCCSCNIKKQNGEIKDDEKCTISDYDSCLE